MQRQKVESMTTCEYRLQVIEQRFWRDVGVEGLRVLEFPHPSVVNDGEDELCRLLPRRLVGSAVCALFFVRSFREHTDDVRGVVVYCALYTSTLVGSRNAAP